MNPVVAVVVVTHNAEPFIDATLTSIASQTRPPDLLLAVDDRSQDATFQELTRAGFEVELATSESTDSITRTAHNFLQGLRMARQRGADIVILGDHDDVWRPDRIAHQLAVLEANPKAAMVASDGFLIDEHGAAVPGTLRGTFPVPSDFVLWPVRRQIAHALRHSLATGGASAIRLSQLDSWEIPAGWLHDRWWSLTALRHGRLVIDDHPVIDYRLSSDQQVGLDRADQHAPVRWWRGKLRQAPASGRKARDVASLLKG